jgi:hypothetical protein
MALAFKRYADFKDKHQETAYWWLEQAEKDQTIILRELQRVTEEDYDWCGTSRLPVITEDDIDPECAECRGDCECCK